MKLTAGFDKREDIYTEYLHEISGIKFTIREIDTISCILHKRGEKKIASFLSISPKTVETHNRNIMTKLRCNSKESIIDFIEKSGKLLQVRQYYLCLLIQTSFEKYLRKIAALNKQGITCVVNNVDTDTKELTHKLKQLQSDLGLANVSLKINAKENLGRELYIYTLANVKEKIPNEWIGLLFGNNFDPSEVKTRNLINFTSCQNYYFAVFDLLERTINNQEIKSIRELFNKEHDALLPVKENIAINPVPQEETKQKLINKYILNFKVLSSITIIITLCFITIGKTLYISNNKINYIQDKTKYSMRSGFNIPTTDKLLERSELVKKIEDKLALNKGINAVALVGVVGMGGAGKTTLARYYGRYVSDATIIWELNAEKKESLINSFQDLAHALTTTAKRKQELVAISTIQNIEEKGRQLLLLVRAWLKEEQKWLLIYDNVENISAIKDYLPQDPEVWGNGKVIITTRDTNIQNSKYVAQYDVIQIEELTDNEKLILFSKIFYNRLPNKLTLDQKQQAVDFLKNIPPFPLDVSAAAYYLKATNTSFGKYLDNLNLSSFEFENAQSSLLKEVVDDNKTRYNIITLSLQHLIDSNKDFASLLLFISSLDSQNIPKDLLDIYKNNIVVDSFIFNLKKYSFITSESSSILGPTFSIHRSTQAIILAYLKQKLDLERNKEPLSQISNSLEIYMNALLDKEDYSKSSFLLNHYESFLSHDKLLTDKITAQIGAVLGGIYCSLGHYNSKTEQLLEKSITNLKLYNNKNTDKIASALAFLGVTTRYLGNYQKGKDLLQQSVAIYQKNQVSHPGVARAMASLGEVYRILGSYDKSEELLQKSITIYQKHQKNHLGSARAIKSLGAVYRDRGDYEKARDLLEQSIVIYKKSTSEHAELAFSMNALGSVYRELGDYEKAKHLLEQSFAIFKKYHFEKYSPYNIAWGLTRLAMVYEILGDYNQAKSLLEKALAIDKEYYCKNDHPNIVWISINLGNVYRKLGDYKKAKDLLEHSLISNKKYYHDEHIHIGQNLWYLGEVYSSLRDYKKARDLLKLSLVIYKNHYGDDHIQVARVLNALGENCLLQEEFKTAETFLNKASEMFQKALHPEVYTVLENLSTLYTKKAMNAKDEKNFEQHQNFKKQAIYYLKQADEIIKTRFPQPSPHNSRIQAKLKELVQ